MPTISTSTRAILPLRIADFRGDTEHLSLEQQAVYLQLLMKAWQLDGSLPDRDRVLAYIGNVSIRKWRRLRPAMAQFFEIRDGRWHHPGLTTELERRDALSAKRAAAAGRRHCSKRVDHAALDAETARVIAKQKGGPF